MVDLEKAKALINEYCRNEFKHDADFLDLENIGIAYTTITDDEIAAQVYVDLLHMQMKYEVAGKEVKKENITLEDLEWLDFDTLIGDCVHYLNEMENK